MENLQNKEKILVIVGPTAVGKSALGVEIARKLGGEIISADSRQVYRGLDVGTGKITKREMRGVPHHLLDVASPKKQFSVAEYQTLAQKKIADILARGKLPIFCGGTGLYVDAALGRVAFPEVPPNLALREKFAEKSAPELFALLQRVAPERTRTIDPHNPRRLVRAIEIALWQNSLSGHVLEKLLSATARKRANFLARKFVSSEKHAPKKSFAEKTIWLGLTLPPNELKKRIIRRLFARIRKYKMINEARRLHKQGLSWKRMEELGLEYRYLSRYLRGRMTKKEMIETLQTEIWRYAKRQFVWFKRNTKIHWFAPSQKKEIFGMLTEMGL